MIKAYILPVAARDALMAYLGNKPYREVWQGMTALMGLETVEEPDPEPEPEEPAPPCEPGPEEPDPEPQAEPE
jgi:hypothetical protein